MKDYITYIADLAAFRAEIESKAEQVKDFAYLGEDGVTVVRIPKCKVYYSDNKTHSISRMNGDQLAACNLIDSIEIIGEAKVNKITCEADVNWFDGGREKYLSITPLETNYVDEDGNDQILTRPDVIACILG